MRSLGWIRRAFVGKPPTHFSHGVVRSRARQQKTDSGFHLRSLCALALFWAFGGASQLAAETIKLSMMHRFDQQRLVLDSFRYATQDGDTFAIRRLSYLISNVAFQAQDGEWVDAGDSVGWIDLERRRESFLIEDVPSGSYRAIRFSVGVEHERNHGDPAQWPAGHALNPALNQLHWTWQDGYIFAAVEGHFRRGEEVSGFVYHLANDWNLREIVLPLDLETNEVREIHLSLDLASWIDFPEPLSFSKDGKSSHSHVGDPVAGKLARNMASAFSVSQVLSRAPIAQQSSAIPIDFPDEYEAFSFRMSSRFPMPPLPADNPLTQERVALGEKLFFDQRLSKDGSISCVSCHDPANVFSDRRVKSRGIDGGLTKRHSMPLFNLAWKESFFWDGRVASLREQVLHPIQDPTEMGASLEAVLAKLTADDAYRGAFERSFASGELNEVNLSLALEAYLLSLTSYRSRFDAAMRGEVSLSEEEQRGFELFMTEYEPRSGRYGADCFHCHGGALFTNNQLRNNGLSISDLDRGRENVTGESKDRGKFVTPSLRNVALTAPYMHDGRFETLEEVVDHYSEGVDFSETLDPNLAKHPTGGLKLSQKDKQALVAFLKTLTDPKFQEIGTEFARD